MKRSTQKTKWLILLLMGFTSIALHAGIYKTNSISNACASEPAFTNIDLTDGDAICLPDKSIHYPGEDINYLAIPGSNKYRSIAISTGHGSGNLDLYVRNGSWPLLNGTDLSSTNAGNGECIVIKNLPDYWTYITVKGSKSKASLVANLGATSCNGNQDNNGNNNDGGGNNNGGNGDSSSRTNGYPYNSAHILVYRFNFSNKRLDWHDLEEDLRKTRDYYREQSYGQFDVTWEFMDDVNIHEPIEAFSFNRNTPSAEKTRKWIKWLNLFTSKIKASGIDPNKPGGNKIIMIASPKIGYNSNAGTSLMKLYYYDAGVIAHEMGHAMGLRHAKAIETGKKTTLDFRNLKNMIDVDRNKYLLNYGNVYSMMGMGASALDEYNLLYKNFFGWLGKTKHELNHNVPLASYSNTYRIYAFDQGKKPHGKIGLRLKSGNNKYTYWVEYRTRGSHSDNAKQGILINMEGFAENETDPTFWKTTSYLLDMTPQSKSTKGWWADDQTDSALLIGKSFDDPWGKFRITPVRKGGIEGTENAWIEVKVEIFKY